MTAEQILETPDLIAVGMAGDEARRALHGTRTTFGRVLEVHVDAVPLDRPPSLDAGEVRIVGTPATLEALTTAVRRVVSWSDGTPVTVSSLDTLLALPDPVAVVAERLAEAGVAAIARVPIDGVEDPAAVVRGLRHGGVNVLAIAVERLDDARRLEICEAAARLQAAVGGFQAFAPLPRTMSVSKPTTGYDDVKLVALARVVAGNIPSIQVDWQLYGPKMAQVALTVGADDVDGVAAVDPGVLGTRRSPLEEIRRNITAAALEPVERDGLFRVREVNRQP